MKASAGDQKTQPVAHVFSVVSDIADSLDQFVPKDHVEWLHFVFTLEQLAGERHAQVVGLGLDGPELRDHSFDPFAGAAAKAGFEEDLKGSIEVGKLADFVITSKDLMITPEEELFNIKVDATYSGGEVIFKR